MHKRIVQFCVLLATIVCVSQTVSGALVLAPDGEAVYDNRSGLFWYADLSDFVTYTYAEQKDAIANLTGSWHMSTLAEYETLALNSDRQIYNTFIRTTETRLSYQTPNDTLIYIYRGRIDEPLGPSSTGTHYLGHMNYDVTHDVTLSPLQVSTTWQDEWYGGAGAWIVANNYSHVLDGAVSTTLSYNARLTLGNTLSFDYWWKMGQEPEGFNLDILFFSGGEWRKFIGWELNFDGSSTEWETASFMVPEYLRGLETELRFQVFDFGADTDPTVFLRNIGSSTAPVPEPSSMLLLASGLVGLAGLRKKFPRS